MNKYPIVGDKLKMLREKHLLKQHELGEILEVSQAFISAIETGLKNPPFEIIEKLTEQKYIQNENYLTAPWRADTYIRLTAFNKTATVPKQIQNQTKTIYFEKKAIVDQLEKDYQTLQEKYGVPNKYQDGVQAVQAIKAKYVGKLDSDKSVYKTLNRLSKTSLNTKYETLLDDKQYVELAKDVNNIILNSMIITFDTPDGNKEYSSTCNLEEKQPIILVQKNLTNQEKKCETIKQVILWLTQESKSVRRVRWENLATNLAMLLSTKDTMLEEALVVNKPNKKIKSLCEYAYGKFAIEKITKELGLPENETNYILT